MRLKMIQLYALSTFFLLTIVVLNYSGSIQFRNEYRTRGNVTLGLVEVDKTLIDLYLKKPRTGRIRVPFSKHFFSTTKSDQIGGFRHLPNHRHPNCQEKGYKIGYSDTLSVIIAFHNECRSALLRTVVSVINRTPGDILKEIILVDDNSQDESDGTDLLIFPYVRLYRNPYREGVIKSRNTGANLATGKYIIFLDSHVEVCDGWMEPLIARISSNPGIVVSPIVDSIDSKSLEYKPVVSHMKGGFNWDLNFIWTPLSPEEQEQRSCCPESPFVTPTVLGGTFMISKDYFHQLGGFDPFLEIMGGEFLELSLKVWLCGGQIEVVPCSRIGHIFRKKLPYKFPKGRQQTHLRNSKRIAESWMDEYKHYFYALHPETHNMDISGSKLSREIKQDMQCKSFRWYLDNIFPELRIPNEEYSAFGKIKTGEKCLTVEFFEKSNLIHLKNCQTKMQNDWGFRRKTGELNFIANGQCLNVQKENVSLIDCSRQPGDKWSRLRGKIFHEKTGLCLDNVYNDTVLLSKCRLGAPSQLFSFSVEVQRLSI